MNCELVGLWTGTELSCKLNEIANESTANHSQLSSELKFSSKKDQIKKAIFYFPFSIAATMFWDQIRKVHSIVVDRFPFGDSETRSEIE